MDGEFTYSVAFKIDEGCDAIQARHELGRILQEPLRIGKGQAIVNVGMTSVQERCVLSACMWTFSEAEGHDEQESVALVTVHNKP